MSEAKAQAGPAGAAARPLSPHLQVWRWHVTLFGSILHRLTGMALYVGAVIVAGWAAALAGGPQTYGNYMHLMGSPLGKLVMFGLTFAVFYHLANGVRHLAWDVGLGFTPRTADMTGAAVIAFAVAATLAVWVIAALVGAL
jgi:succinate dehydrogenase / fumarate reductase cytochrome b subunit